MAVPGVVADAALARMVAEVVALRQELAAEMPGLRRLAAEVSDLRRLATEVSDVRRLAAAVSDLQRDADRKFLGYDIFATTAVFVAICVAAYQLVRDPTGEQHAADLSELRVYRQWRTALSCLISYVALVAAVMVVQLRDGWRGRDIWWLLAIMWAPWAPVINKVWSTLRRTRRVRSMMVTRGCRNRLTAMLREYLFLGHAGLSTAAASYALGFTTKRPPSPQAPPGLPENKKEWVSFVGHSPSRLPLSDRGRQESPHPDDLTLPYLSRWDVFAWWWSRNSDCVPPAWGEDGLVPRRRRGGRATRRRAAAGPDGAGPTEVSSPFRLQPVQSLTPWQETLVLDAIDGLVASGTIPEPRFAKLPRGICDLCLLSLRSAVEAFLESSSRRHAGVSAREWFHGVRFHWTLKMDTILHFLWQAAFCDNDGLRIDVTPAKTPPETQPATPAHELDVTEATRHVLMLLFLLSRSMLGGAPALRDVRHRVEDHLHSNVWWESYWQHFVPPPGDDGLNDPAAHQTVDDALRATVTTEVRSILQLLLVGVEDESLIEVPTCGTNECWLEEWPLIVARLPTWVPPPPCDHCDRARALRADAPDNLPLPV
ncbi:hypothetical protein I4F81_007146 [Pyropia yezoensis]|uniref:Uncharacterized protein n=1 Tax=Pyropia yezoensis TaxID=2788 RepID=A0ACC3C2T0_PYRYE|nr:hypothetical protein I4F81_007146 [Neopyropia yezoensis]